VAVCQLKKVWKRGKNVPEHKFTFEQIRLVSLGGILVATAGDDAVAFATFAHLPSSDVLKSFGLTRNEADAIWDIFKPIATSLKLEYEWSREQDQVTLKLSHSGSPNA
jgi:hypothetical protein